MHDQAGVVFADLGFGCVDEEHFAAVEQLFEVESVWVAQQQVGFAGGDQPFEFVAGRVERLRREAAVAREGGEFAAPVGAREVGAGLVVELVGDVVAGVGLAAEVEHAVDVPERRFRFDGADGCDRLAQEAV